MALFMVYQVNISQELLMCQSLEILSQKKVCSLGHGKTWTSSTDGGEVLVQRSPEHKDCLWPWGAESEGKGEGLTVESYWVRVEKSASVEAPVRRSLSRGAWVWVLDCNFLSRRLHCTLVGGQLHQGRLPNKTLTLSMLGAGRSHRAFWPGARLLGKNCEASPRILHLPVGKPFQTSRNKMNTSVLLEQSLGQPCELDAGGNEVWCVAGSPWERLRLEPHEGTGGMLLPSAQIRPGETGEASHSFPVGGTLLGHRNENPPCTVRICPWTQVRNPRKRNECRNHWH